MSKFPITVYTAHLLIMSEKAHDIKSSYSEDEEKGYDRKPVKLGGFKLFAFAFSTLGIIYSDIGEAVLRLNLPMAPPHPSLTVRPS